MAKRPCVYILASGRNGTLYIGVTAYLIERLERHRGKKGSAFASKYDVKRLVHCEFFETMAEAIAREKQLKKWRRAWKVQLIAENNPAWRDLYDDLHF